MAEFASAFSFGCSNRSLSNFSISNSFPCVPAPCVTCQCTSSTQSWFCRESNARTSIYTTRDLILVRPDCKMQNICFVMPFWPREILVLLRSVCSSLHNNVNGIDGVKEYKKKKPKKQRSCVLFVYELKEERNGTLGFSTCGL